MKETGGGASMMNRKRLLISVILLALAICGLANAEGSGCEGQTELTEIGSSLSSGSYYLGDDLTDTSSSNLKITGDVTLCLHGHTLDLNGQYISLTAGSSFTVCDCSSPSTGVITTAASQLVKIDGSNAVMTLNSGKLTHSGSNGTIEANSSNYSFTITVNGGEINATAGVGIRIQDNGAGAGSQILITGGAISASACAVAVKDVDATLRISGDAEISCPNASGTQTLYLSKATTEISGGTITGSSPKNVIQLANSAALTMSGGRVTQNGGTHSVSVSAGCTFTMTGGTVESTVATWAISALGYVDIQGGSVSSTGSGALSYTGSQSCTISGGSFTGKTYGLLVENADAAAQVSGGTFTGQTAPAAIKSGVALTLSGILAEGSQFYADSAFEEPIVLTDGQTSITSPKTVYVSAATIMHTVTMLKDSEAVFSTSVKNGGTYTLPQALQAEDGTIYAAESYTMDAETRQPGDSITVESDVTLVLNALTHTCSGIEFATAINADTQELVFNGNKLTSGTYFLQADLALTEGSAITVSGEVKLCLNGHTLSLGRFIVAGNAVVDIYDCSGTNAGTISGSASPVVNVQQAGAEVTLHGGTVKQTGTGYTLLLQGDSTVTIAGGVMTNQAGCSQCIYATSGRLNMTGGRIEGHGDSHAVSVLNSCAFVASGGTIISYGYESTTTADDGTTTTGNAGAALHLSGGGTATLANCVIESTDRSTNAVLLQAGTLTVNDGAQILGNNSSSHENAATSGSFKTVRLNNAASKLIMNGGSIETRYDDALYIERAEQVTINGGTILGGYDGYTDGRSAIYIMWECAATVELNGGQVSNPYEKGIAITNYGKLAIQGSAVVSATRYALWDKQREDAPTAVTISGDAALTGGVAAVQHGAGTLKVTSGTMTGGQYGLRTEGYATSVILSGGVYICDAESGVSPVSTGLTDNVSTFLDSSVEGLAYYTDATGDETFDAEVTQLAMATSNTAYVRTGCTHPDWEVVDNTGVCTQCGMELVYFYGDQLQIGTDLSMTFYVRVLLPGVEASDWSWDGWSMKITRPHSSNDQTYEASYGASSFRYSSGTGLLSFTYSGVNPQCMTTPITATLTCGDRKLTKTDTVQAYCVRASAQTGDTSQLTVMANLLNYGAACQTYRQWYQDQPANAGDAAALVSEYATAPSRPQSVSNWQENFKITGCVVRLSYKTELGFCVDDADGMTLRIYDGETLKAEKEITQSSDRLYIDVAPQYFGTTYTGKLYQGEELICSMDYSVNSYISAGWDYSGSAAFVNLMKQMGAFGDAVRTLAAN